MSRMSERRRATVDDAEAIAGIVRSLGDDDVGLPGGLDATGVKEWIRRLGEDGTIVIAFDGSIPIAFGSLDFNTAEPDISILGVWVLPDYRRRGIATEVAEMLLDFARERGYKRIRGRLPADNEPALSFLSSIGGMVPLRNPNMTFELPL